MRKSKISENVKHILAAEANCNLANRKPKTTSTNKRLISPLPDIAWETIARYAMVSPEDSLLVGVSGGPDSVALLLLLIEITGSAHNFNNRIGVAHINHSLRGDESDRDEAFVIHLAEKYNLPCHTIKVDVPAVAMENRLSFEEAARDVRYSFYSQIAAKEHYNKIALGHNSDDNAELVLMNLLRGSGTKGIAGIPPVRDNHSIKLSHIAKGKPTRGNSDIVEHNNKIIRPMIEISREDILEYLKLKNQQYVVDSSNDDIAYLRNRIRHSLIPHLKERYNPSVTESINKLSRIIMDENSWMEEETERIFHNSTLETEKYCSKFDQGTGSGNNKNPENKEQVYVDRKAFTDIHHALAKRLIRRAIQEVKGDLKRITFNHIDDILHLIYSTTGGTTVHLPDRIRVIKSRQNICFRKESRPLREIGNKKEIYYP